MMSWKWLIGLNVFVLCPLTVTAAVDLGAGRISFIQGFAQIQPAGSKEWQVASVNVPIRAGDRFWTAEDARMELQFKNGTILRLDYSTTLAVLNLDETAMQFHLSMGHLLFRSSRKPTKTIQVDLPDSSLVVQDKALFRVDITPEGGEEFGLFQGSMEIASAGSKARIRTGEMLTLENGSAEVTPLQPADEWEQWNTNRDLTQSNAAVSAQYLPQELNVYANDLNNNGDWVNIPGYGYCWEPRVGIAVGWAPYRSGRWIWMNEDWVWVSLESWGWAPYHYGRWVSYSDRWCWVPPVRGESHWGPGYVGWIHTPRYVGWVPLAPGEILRRGESVQGRYHNLPHSGATTVVERAGFIRGQVVPITLQGNLVASGNYKVGLPGIRPHGIMHVGPVVPSNRLPAPAIRALNVQQLRQQHPALHVVPPQTHQYRPGYNAPRPAAQGVRGRAPAPVPGAGGVWGNRSVKNMWWVNPKAAGAPRAPAQNASPAQPANTGRAPSPASSTEGSSQNSNGKRIHGVRER